MKCDVGTKEKARSVTMTRRASGKIPGSDLLSHRPAPAVPSAVEGLTSVFGMGTGVTPPLWPPGNLLAAGDGRFRHRAPRRHLPSEVRTPGAPTYVRGMTCSRASFKDLSEGTVRAAPSALWRDSRAFGPTEHPANGSVYATPRSGLRIWQASRPISTSQLRMSPPLHTWPITWWSTRSLQGLASREISSRGGFHA